MVLGNSSGFLMLGQQRTHIHCKTDTDQTKKTGIKYTNLLLIH